MSESCDGKRVRNLQAANAFLTVSVVIGLVFIAAGVRYTSKLQAENTKLKADLQRFAGGLTGGGAQAGDLLPPFDVIDLKGKRATVVYDGRRKHLLYFFSSRCGTCLSQLPFWNQVAVQAKARGYVVLGVSSDSVEVTKANVRTQGFEIASLDDNAVLRAYRVDMIPMIVLTSPSGHLEWLHYGPITEDKRRELLSMFL